MTPEEFVKIFHTNKQDQFANYLNNQDTYVSSLINQLDPDEKGITILREIIDTVLTDTYYTFLLGIDGAANIGGVQQLYKLFDQNKNELTGSGQIEGFAYEYFHGDKS
ncbi:hypothetical protein SNE26_16475 [Mucilaginibacter sp. cycad4]|uniref:hypothetical protein n=1 Tax=Mucilaginibacter sp. cycad4 TaxID=3342096 RepID=UPI002AAB7A4E|nr:hypothetical protein [Mucilaginibacter gossypii]WPU97623.1 hypothetical protein SNE26_16475 [Mucilaginibacter gossypii]